MNTNVDISHVTYIPACYCTDGHARVLVDSDGILKDRWAVAKTPVKPVYVRIGGRVREAKRWLWPWGIVEDIQEGLNRA